MTIKGRIIKGIGGFYYVEPTDSLFLDQPYECKALGKFRYEKNRPFVGDLVEIQEQKGQWVITKILKRTNKLIRPPVSNVDLALLCISVDQPKPDLELLDKLTVNSFNNSIKPVICLTKIDLDPEKAEEIAEIYKKAGFGVLKLSTVVKDDIEKLYDLLKGQVAFLAGQSGVGKSTLANRFCENQMQTGDISIKLKRGKHTTRHVELLKTKIGSFLLDTPGFSSIELEDTLEAEDLKYFFPEFEDFKCRFNNCNHYKEPGCAVKDGVKKGQISKSRYLSYKKLYEFLKERKPY